MDNSDDDSKRKELLDDSSDKLKSVKYNLEILSSNDNVDRELIIESHEICENVTIGKFPLLRILDHIPIAKPPIPKNLELKGKGKDNQDECE